jgi:putative membrane protein
MSDPEISQDPPEPPPPSAPRPGDDDPLRRSRASHAWVSVVVFALLLVLLTVFIAQNTDRVSVQFFGWTWHAPLAVAALTGVVVGMVLAVVAGTTRIWQLRRRVRRTS